MAVFGIKPSYCASTKTQGSTNITYSTDRPCPSVQYPFHISTHVSKRSTRKTRQVTTKNAHANWVRGLQLSKLPWLQCLGICLGPVDLVPAPALLICETCRCHVLAAIVPLGSWRGVCRSGCTAFSGARAEFVYCAAWSCGFVRFRTPCSALGKGAVVGYGKKLVHKPMG